MMDDPDDTDISEEEDEFEQPGKCISSAESHPSAALVCLRDTSGMQAAQSNNLANSLAQAAQPETVAQQAMAALDGTPKGLSGCQQYGDSDQEDTWRPSQRACDPSGQSGATGQPGGARQPGQAEQAGTQCQAGGEQHGCSTEGRQGGGPSPTGALEVVGMGAMVNGWHGDGANKPGDMVLSPPTGQGCAERSEALSAQHNTLGERHGMVEGAPEGPGRGSPGGESPRHSGSKDRQSNPARQPKEEWPLASPRGPIQEFQVVGPIDLTDPELVTDPLVQMAANNHRMSSELKALNRALEQRVDMMQLELKRTRAERDALHSNVTHLEEDLRSKRAELVSLEEGTTRIAGKNRELQSSVSELRTMLAETQEQCAHAHVDRLIYEREVQRFGLLQTDIQQLQERLAGVNGELGATQNLLAAERQLRGILEQEMQELQEAAAPLQSYFLKAGSKRQRTESDECRQAGSRGAPLHQPTENGGSLDASARRQRSIGLSGSAIEQNVPNGHGNGGNLSPSSRQLQGSPQGGASPNNLVGRGGASPTSPADILANSWAGSGRQSDGQPGTDLRAEGMGNGQPGYQSRADGMGQGVGKGPDAISFPPAVPTSASQDKSHEVNHTPTGEAFGNRPQHGNPEALATGQQPSVGFGIGEVPPPPGWIYSSTPTSGNFSYPASSAPKLPSVLNGLPLPLPLNVPPPSGGPCLEQLPGHPTSQALSGGLGQGTTQGLATYQQPPTSLMDVLITSRQPAPTACQPPSWMISQGQNPGSSITQPPAGFSPQGTAPAESAKAAEPENPGSSATQTAPRSSAQPTGLAEAAKAAESAKPLAPSPSSDPVTNTLALGAMVLPGVGARGVLGAAASDPGRQGPPVDTAEVSSFIKIKPQPAVVELEDSDPGSDGDDLLGDRPAGNVTVVSQAPRSVAAQEATPSGSGKRGGTSSNRQGGAEEVEGMPTPSGKDTASAAKRPKTTERSRGGITKPSKRKGAGRGRGKQPGKGAGRPAVRGRGKGRGRGTRARLGPPTSEDDTSDDDVVPHDTRLKRRGKNSLSKGQTIDSLAAGSGALGRGNRRSTAGVKSVLSDDYVLE